jgi:long-chain acyl-CoA synthetase
MPAGRMLGCVESTPPRGVAAIARAEPERVALVFRGGTWSFCDLDRAANGVATSLDKASIAPGDRVAVMLGNVKEIFAAHHGVARLGALVVPVSWRLTAPEIAYILEDSGARYFVHDGSDAAREAASLAGLATKQQEVGELCEPTDLPPTDEFIGSPVTTMGYTSGTTGRPKGILRPPPQPAKEAPLQPFAQFWGFGPEDVHLLCGPAYHTAPGAYAHMTLVEGGRVVVMERFDATECLRLIESERVTTSHMVPANFVRIVQADWRSYDLSSVRKILHAAAPCPVALKRRVMEVFPPGSVWEYYGASEGMASVISPEEWLAKPGSVGKPFPGLQVRILDDEGKELPPGEVGTVYVSTTPSARFEYHNAPEKTAAAWRDGFFTVGDMGWLDEDGYLFLADRRSDLIITGGVNVYPAEVEQAFMEEADVVDIAVIGLLDEEMGQRVHAIVEMRPGVRQDPGELLARVSRRLARFKLPRTIEFVDELPREPNGKVLKNRLREERSTRGR